MEPPLGLGRWRRSTFMNASTSARMIPKKSARLHPIHERCSATENPPGIVVQVQEPGADWDESSFGIYSQYIA